jgi:hypothetical protein
LYLESEGDPIRKICDPRNTMRLGGQSIRDTAPGHSRSGIWNPKATLYETYRIPDGICDFQPDQFGSCMWNPKGTLYEKYPIPEITRGSGDEIYRGNCAWPFTLWHMDSEGDPIRTHIGSHTEYGIPTLTSQALAFGIRRRPYTKHIGSHLIISFLASGIRR